MTECRNIPLGSIVPAQRKTNHNINATKVRRTTDSDMYSSVTLGTENLLKRMLLNINLMPLLHLSFQPVPVIISKAAGFDQVQRKSL